MNVHANILCLVHNGTPFGRYDANNQNLPQSGRLLYCVRSRFLDIYQGATSFRPRDCERRQSRLEGTTASIVSLAICLDEFRATTGRVTRAECRCRARCERRLRISVAPETRLRERAYHGRGSSRRAISERSWVRSRTASWPSAEMSKLLTSKPGEKLVSWRSAPVWRSMSQRSLC